MLMHIDVDRIRQCSAKLVALAERIERDTMGNRVIDHAYLWRECAIQGGTALCDAMRAGGFTAQRPGLREKLLAVYGDARKHQEWFQQLVAHFCSSTFAPPD